MSIFRKVLQTKHFKSDALLFVPENYNTKIAAIFTHGFTSCKTPLLSWSEKLYQTGIASLIFDLPGHYLGGASEVLDLDLFATEAPELFEEGEKLLKLQLQVKTTALGGHSLGALLALKFCQKHVDKHYPIIAVGFAGPTLNGKHLYQEKVFEQMLEFRSQLVSPALHHHQVFPWIRKEKEALSLKEQTIFLLSGKDDLVAKEEDVVRLSERLNSQGNKVELLLSNKLPHHEPERAAPYIRDYLKKYYGE